MSESPSPKRDLFPETRFSLVSRAASSDPGIAMKAMDDLARAYQRPILLSVLARGYSREDAEDHAQSFLAGFIQSGNFNRFDPEKGRLRCFLSRCLRNHLNKAYGRESREPVQTELEDWSASDPNSPDIEFDRSWARELLSKATGKLEQEHSHSEDSLRRFKVLRGLLPITPESGLIKQAAISLATSEDAVRQATFKLRRRLRDLLECEVRETVGLEDFDSELAYLIELLRTQTPPGPNAA